MKRYTVLALGLALALAGVGVWANDNGNAVAPTDQGTQLQAPAAPDQNQAQPNTAPPDQKQAQPDNAPPNNTPPTAAPPDQQQPNAAQPNAVQPNNAPPNQAPGASATNSGAFSSPMQEFVSQNVNEVGELSQQIDQFRAAKRPEAVMALYHMIRDHTLVADAARNVLARRGDVSEPTIIVPEAMANTPDDMIKHDIQMHEQALSQVQQLLANASSPEEKNIYQRAVNATNKHLGWLNAMNQGQTVQIGFFGPTTPLNRIAGYREETTTSRVAGYQQAQSRRVIARHRRHRRGRYHTRRPMRRYR